MRVWFTGGILLLLVGCASTLADFRRAPLESFGTIATTPQAAALCFLDHLDALPQPPGQMYRLVPHAPPQPTSLVGYRMALAGPFMAAPSPFVEFLFTPQDQHTAVQIRREGYPYADEQVLTPARHWLQTCAGGDADAPPPAASPSAAHPTAP